MCAAALVWEKWRTIFAKQACTGRSVNGAIRSNHSVKLRLADFDPRTGKLKVGARTIKLGWVIAPRCRAPTSRSSCSSVRRVGCGPSSNTWPRCPPQRAQVTSVRRISHAPFSWNSTAPGRIGAQKLGHPVPDSYFVSASNSSAPHPAQR